MPTETRIGAVILAGGRATRLDGQDKGLLPLAGRPLAAWVLDRLDGQVASVVINANRHLDAYRTLGLPVVTDALPDYPGPLAGVLAAAALLPQPWLLAVPCDTPFLPRTLAARLLAAAEAQGTRLARAAEAAREHYAIMLLHRDLLTDLNDYLQSGGRRVQAWQARHAPATVIFAEAGRAFHNINTQADLDAAAEGPTAE